jgi:predicted TIM-barrel fold metal-dependent hydrolase
MNLPKPIISADSHVLEQTETLWVEGLPARYREHAPRLFLDSGNKLAFGSDLMPARAVSQSEFWSAGKNPASPQDLVNQPSSSGRPGGWDPSERVKDLALDGVVAEVLYPSLALALFGIKDAGFQEACMRVYNDWLAEYVRFDPKRYVGLGLISCFDAGHAVAELHRTKRAGLGGALIWAEAPDEFSFMGRHHDPLFAAAAELDMPISLHIGTGAKDSGHFEPGRSLYLRSMFTHFELLRALPELIFTGVFDRFPHLKVILCEYGLDWFPAFIKRADRAHDRYRATEDVKLAMRPSDYFLRNIWMTFIRDAELEQHVAMLGGRHVMWSSDYPHASSTWPNSTQVIAADMAGLSDEEAALICRDTVTELYSLDLASLEADPLPAVTG